MSLFGIDIGTTHCKAAVFGEDGTLVSLSSQPTRTSRSSEGELYYHPEELWETLASVIREAAASVDSRSISAIGIASMAESGLLVDRQTGEPRSPFLPWFDTRATAQAEALKNLSDPRQRFSHSGLRPSYKLPLAKLLWLREREPGITNGTVWLSAADSLLYRLTGVKATDYSLAGRTYAFWLERQTWDVEWLEKLGLGPELFPPALPSGTPAGRLTPEMGRQLGLPADLPVAVAGHDHVCAALAAGAVQPSQAFDSMGTAETLLGVLDAHELGEKEFLSGLSFGRHVLRGKLYWMGGLSASGGSVEWLRGVLNDPALSYANLKSLLDRAPTRPGRILYFPYLAGSGSPHTDSQMRGAFLGLSAEHDRADLVKAVLEGTAYELELIKRAAEGVTGSPIHQILAAGGGIRNQGWMQIKADVSGASLRTTGTVEATLLGAALLAGIGSGAYRDEAGAFAAVKRIEVADYTPVLANSAIYRRLYEQGYEPLRAPLRKASHLLLD